MLFTDQTKQAVIESVLRLKARLEALTIQDVTDVRMLCANTTAPVLPNDMTDDLQIEYRQEFIPLGLASVIVSNLQSAMYGRTVSCVIEEQEKNEQLQNIIDNWRMAAPSIYNRCLKFGYTVTRFYPDFRRGVVHGSYDPDEVTPILDPETESIDPIGLIYHYKVPAESVPFTAPANAKEALIVERITVNKRNRLTGEIEEQGVRERWLSFDGGSKWQPWPYSEDDNGLNPYGDHLGAVLWRNDVSDEPLGTSDILPLRGLFAAISGTCTDLKLLLKWNVWPTTWSNSPGFADLPYGWRQSYELASDGSGNAPSVGMIEMNPASLESGMKFLKLLLAMMHETSSVPAVAMGNLDGIGNLSSGRALEVVMMSLRDLTLRRQKLQEYQEERATREMMVVLAHAQAETKGKDEFGIMTETIDGITYPNAYQIPISIEFGQLGLSANSDDQVSYYTGLYAAGLYSLMECLKGLHPTWDDTQLTDEYDRIKAETDSREGTVVDDGRAQRIANMIETEE